MRRSLLQVSLGIMVAASFVLAGGGALDAVGAARDVCIQFGDAYTNGLNTGNLNLWISLWDQNGIQMAPDAPSVVGKERILAKYEKIFPQFVFEIAIKNEETKVAGVWAYCRGTYTISLTPKGGGETGFVDGKYLTILRKQTDGSWKVFRDIFNSNVPSR